jgi:DNA polymerase elongation subunit (family B)
VSEISLTEVLYGADPTERVVAVETLETTATLFIRGVDDALTTRQVPFSPWLIAEVEGRFPGAEEVKLDGDGYNVLYRFRGWSTFLDARRELRDEHASVMQYGSSTKQFLISSGITLFKGMTFDDLRRMQVDIETTTLDPQAPGARIFLIAISDNRGLGTVLSGDERSMLRELVDIIADRDPDVIEGHNFYSFDLPYILTRCRALGVAPAFGRGGAQVSVGQRRNCAIGANTREFVPVYLYGRHVIDTLLAVQRFDVARGQLSSYGLKECAQVYGFAPADRVYLDRAQITEIYRADPEKVKTYALHDVEETSCLSSLVTPTEFYQTQIVPESLQTVAVTGSGEKINSVLVREYLRQGLAIPRQKSPKPYPGGYTEVRLTGVLRPVVKADVESLYPSLMLVNKIAPKSDTLGIFLPMLRELTNRRLHAKAMAKSAGKTALTPSPLSHRNGRGAGDSSATEASQRRETDFAYWDGLQNSFKTLINSFYGYIGGPFLFNDFDAARTVTEAGQAVVKQIAAELEATGAKVIEIDTDGVYFTPPPGVDTREAEIDYVERIGDTLPAGIRLAHDGSYAAMLSLKMKNYVLVEYGGKKVYKGSSLRSRADERFGRRFLGEAIDLLLGDRKEEASALYKRVLDEIEAGQMPVELLARRERVTDKMISSELRRRAAAAIRDSGASHGDFISLYQKRDKSLALIHEYAGDEDTEHYGQKLYRFVCRIREAFGEEEFDLLFPKPIPYSKRPDPAQLTMDLFG